MMKPTRDTTAICIIRDFLRFLYVLSSLKIFYKVYIGFTLHKHQRARFLVEGFPTNPHIILLWPLPAIGEKLHLLVRLWLRFVVASLLEDHWWNWVGPLRREHSLGLTIWNQNLRLLPLFISFSPSHLRLLIRRKYHHYLIKRRSFN
jgi:hypothetical protein